jgi:hypothetical protein
MSEYGDQRLPERFWSKVTANEQTGCWEWTASLNRSGYGQFSVDRRPVGSHRVAYIALVGPIPEGKELDHLCRVRHCVNPAHLDPVTRAEHILRSPYVIAVINAAKTHCPHGHEYSPENTWRNARGARWCRGCSRESMRRIKARQRSARPDNWMPKNVKLTADAVAAMRRGVAQGDSTSALAAQYGVAYRTAVGAIKGETWQHVSEPPVALSAWGRMPAGASTAA